MPDIEHNQKIKPIAFYLPQFHAIPENDSAWGDGFTEWTNVKKARPLFEGHYQPRIPLNHNYYNLLDKDVLVEQSRIAQQYGVFGFCYYHYWFKNGKKLLEKPIEDMLHNKAVTIPYCLSWANENWTKKWDGGNKEIIVEQDYGGMDDWEKHFLYLLPYFQDDRYILLDGKPVFLIYKPNQIPCIQSMLRYFEKRAHDVGLKGICFIVQNGSVYYDINFDIGMFSYIIKFEPFFSAVSKRKKYWFIKKRLFNLMRMLHVNKKIHELFTKSSVVCGGGWSLYHLSRKPLIMMPYGK